MASLHATLVRVRSISEQIYAKSDSLWRPGQCAHRAAIASVVSSLLGLRPVIQGGTCFWPRTPWQGRPTQDGDFGYQFLDCEATWERARQDMLPEMHVWLAYPNDKILVDPSSGLLPDHCRDLLGKPWDAPKPPDWFIANINDGLPPGVSYQPETQGCLLASVFVSKVGAELLRLNPTLADNLRGVNPTAFDSYRPQVTSKLGLPGCPVRYPDMNRVRVVS